MQYNRLNFQYQESPHANAFSGFFAIRQELYDWRLWAGRAVVMAFAALAGLIVVAFTWLTEQAFAQFVWLKSSFWWGLCFGRQCPPLPLSG